MQARTQLGPLWAGFDAQRRDACVRVARIGGPPSSRRPTDVPANVAGDVVPDLNGAKTPQADTPADDDLIPWSGPMAPHSHAVVLASTVPEGLKAPGSGWDIQSIDPPRPPSGSILPGVAGEIASVLRELGADPAPVFRAAGLDPAMSTDPNAIIPLGAFCALIARSGACTGCPHFGLLLGQRVQLPALGLVGSLMLHSETVGDALRSLIRHVEMQCMGATTALTANDGTAVWSCVVYEPGTDCADQVADAAAAAATNVMRALCGGDWSPTEVHLPRAVPEDQPTYRRLFRAPVRFNREAAALVFPALHLDRVLQGADPCCCGPCRTSFKSGRAGPPLTSSRGSGNCSAPS